MKYLIALFLLVSPGFAWQGKAAARGAVLVGSIGFCAGVLTGHCVFCGLQALMPV